MTRYEKFYSIVKKNKKYFEFLTDYLSKSNDIEIKEYLAKTSLNFAVCKCTGYYASAILENFYTDYAKSIDINDYDIVYKPNSFLHVMTLGANAGGHTRVVERWIENAPETQMHSVVFLSQNNEKMTTIEENVKNKNGNCFYFESSLSMTEKALKLRELGMHYEYVILHIHMDDPTAVVAFGNEKFTRPVLLYNHASHLFWIGKSIADLVLDIFSNDEVTIKKRNIKNRYFLGVPSKEIKFNKVDKSELRHKLGLPADKKIIISSGSAFKYKPILDDNIIPLLEKIIDENTYCYIIGVGKSNNLWNAAYKRTKGHIVPMDYVNFKDGYMDWLGAADLYLDSFPFPGGTAMIDAISMGTPALSLETIQPQFDYLTSTDALCHTKQDYLNKIKKILNNPDYKSSNIKMLQDSILKNQSKETWNDRIDKLLEIVPKKHCVKHIDENICIIDDCAVVNNIMYNDSFLKKEKFLYAKSDILNIAKYGNPYKHIGIPYIFEILTLKKNRKKHKIIKLFNKQIIHYAK